MIRIGFVAVLLLSCNLIFAQDFLSGKQFDKDGKAIDIFYDRTQLIVSSSSHQSLYKVVDINRKPLYNIFVTNDNEKNTISISISNETSGTQGKVITYDNHKCGLIFCNTSNIDTVFQVDKDVIYLISFTDTLRDYPILHKLKVTDNITLALDPLTRLRVKKHDDIVKRFYVGQELVKTDVANITPSVNKISVAGGQQQNKDENAATHSLFNNQFNTELFALRDSLYAKNASLIESITVLRNSLEYDLTMYMKDIHTYGDEIKYAGEERNGQPQGKGILVYEGNIFDGTFNNGFFINGKAMLKSKTSVYYGESTKDSMTGRGWLKYNNGSFLLGEFRNDRFFTGISLAKENGEVFFGNITNGQRTGYGELKNNRGDCYYGEFMNGKLIKGYCKEVDQFGYSTYSKIESGSKATVSAQIAQAFFDSIHTIKEKAETQP